jgi:hypothetical protein
MSDYNKGEIKMIKLKELIKDEIKNLLFEKGIDITRDKVDGWKGPGDIGLAHRGGRYPELRKLRSPEELEKQYTMLSRGAVLYDNSSGLMRGSEYEVEKADKPKRNILRSKVSVTLKSTGDKLKYKYGALTKQGDAVESGVRKLYKEFPIGKKLTITYGDLIKNQTQIVRKGR